MRYLAIILLVITCKLSIAQDFYVTGATVHIGNGEVFENGLIEVQNGKIKMVVDARVVKIDLTGKEVINAYGKHIYPGIIAPNTKVGLVEIDGVRATKDYQELGDFTPNIRTLIAYNTDSDVVATLKSSGILYTQVVPYGGLISGSSSVVKTKAWNWEDAVVAADDGIHLRWPARFSRSGWWANPGTLSENENYQPRIEEIENFLNEAKAYHHSSPKTKNLKFEATKGLFEGTQNLYIHAGKVKEMLSAINLAERLEIKKIVIVGGEEAPEISDLLVEKNIPVIVGNIISLPMHGHSDVDESYKLPSKLQAAGVKYCIGMTKYYVFEYRNLIVTAGIAANYGLTKEQAISAITKNAAEILGIENLGTLETGKDASFIITEGDVLDIITSNVERAFVEGLEIDLSNKQLELKEKYLKKYKDEGKL